MRIRRGFGGLMLAGTLALVGCESGPKGPGDLTGTVSGGSTLGAVTLEVVGPGIQGFGGLGDTRAYGALVSQRDQRHRVVLVHPSGGTFQFTIAVSDRGARTPSIDVLAAAGTDNRTISPAGIVVSIQP